MNIGCGARIPAPWLRPSIWDSCVTPITVSDPDFQKAINKPFSTAAGVDDLQIGVCRWLDADMLRRLAAMLEEWREAGVSPAASKLGAIF
eukprot:SAG11_NODE_15420_length_579_cov_0.518750_2_plen_90_part_00